MKPPTITFEQTSAGGYIVRIDGREIGHVGGKGSRWYATSADFNLGEHKSRADAVEALLDVDRT